MRFKLCGIARREDLILAGKLGFDYTGFIFHPPSPRYISPEEVRRIMPPKGGTPKRVGVFVDTPADRIRSAAAEAYLDLIQLHGGEDRPYCDALGLPWWKALRIGGPEDLHQMDSFEGSTVLLDAYVRGRFGGTGKRLRRELVEAALKRTEGRDIRLILAGGLTETSMELLEELPLWGADFNSGLEIVPGRKDPEKMRRLMDRAAGLRGRKT